MPVLRVGIIGTGKKKDRPDRFGYAMAYRHAQAYQLLENCEVVACADIVEENAAAFAEEFGVPVERVTVHQGDTDTSPRNDGSWGSRVLFGVG